MNVYVKLEKEDFLAKNGVTMTPLRVTITNLDNGLSFDFLDFNFVIPSQLNKIEFKCEKEEDVKKDSYNRYCLKSYTLSGKYSFAFEYLLSGSL